jgi:hypothetical protein
MKLRMTVWTLAERPFCTTGKTARSTPGYHSVCPKVTHWILLSDQIRVSRLPFWECSKHRTPTI